MLKKNLFFLALLILAFSLIPKPVFAVGSILGKTYTKYNEAVFPLKDVLVDKFREDKPNKSQCNENNPAETCLNVTDPLYTQPFYTREDGVYRMTEESPTLFIPQLGEKRNYCNQDTARYVRFGCGTICSENPTIVRARFPNNYDLNYFPSGIDFRKGKWKVHINSDSSVIRVFQDKEGNEFFLSTSGNTNEVNVDFEWIPDPLPIAGIVVDSKSGQGIPNATIQVQDDQAPPTTKNAISDQNGKFNVPIDNFIKPGQRYSVRMTNAPLEYALDSRVVTTTGWSWNHFAQRNSIPPDRSYEHQILGSDDCAGPDNDITANRHQIARCNFQLDPEPGSIGDNQCTNVAANSLLIDNQTLPFNSTNPLSLTLRGFPGQSSFTIPVAINTGNACRIYNLRFNYTAPSQTSSPDPFTCTRSSGRAEGCACTSNNQCQAGTCDLTRRICSAPAFIKTEGGDVHSNVKIEQ